MKGKKLELKCKELNLKSKDDVKEFHKYLTSSGNKYFIRKYRNKYYGFTVDIFNSIYYDFEFDFKFEED